MKKLSSIFTLLAILLTNIMCVVVTYNCTVLRYAPGNSAPWEVGLILIIPFAFGIITCAIVTYVAKKREKD
jgi:predicted Na+-dependent transporter